MLAVLLLLMLLTLQHILIEWSVVPLVFGAVGALWLNMVLWAGVALVRRCIAASGIIKRRPAWFFAELALIALGTAVVFFPHQRQNHYVSTLAQRFSWLGPSDLSYRWHWGLSVLLARTLPAYNCFKLTNRRHFSVVLFPLLPC